MYYSVNSFWDFTVYFALKQNTHIPKCTRSLEENELFDLQCGMREYITRMQSSENRQYESDLFPCLETALKTNLSY